MPITQSKTINELLFRWNDSGALQGAHVIFRESVADAGVEIYSRLTDPQSVAVAGAAGVDLAELIPVVAQSALARADLLTTQKTAAESARDAAQAQVVDLQTQLAALQPPADINGVPQSVPRRQAKTIMELTPSATHGDLWQAALSAAGAIEDRAARIVTTNYLLESLYFEHPKVSELAVGLLGMTKAQVDQLFIAASKL